VAIKSTRVEKWPEKWRRWSRIGCIKTGSRFMKRREGRETNKTPVGDEHSLHHIDARHRSDGMGRCGAKFKSPKGQDLATAWRGLTQSVCLLETLHRFLARFLLFLKFSLKAFSYDIFG